jgi:hypothetical protein
MPINLKGKLQLGEIEYKISQKWLVFGKDVSKPSLVFLKTFRYNKVKEGQR